MSLAVPAGFWGVRWGKLLVLPRAHGRVLHLSGLSLSALVCVQKPEVWRWSWLEVLPQEGGGRRGWGGPPHPQNWLALGGAAIVVWE